MTLAPLKEDEEAVIGSALAMLWQRHRQSNLDRISLLEVTAANVLKAAADDDAIAEGARAAHKLAGSLGTFGFDAGSRAALEAESLLREPVIDGRLLAEAVTALRASVEEVADPGFVSLESAPSDVPLSNSGLTALIASSDADLISRLTVEAAAVGLTMSSCAEIPTAAFLGMDQSPSIFVDDTATNSWTRPEILDSVTELARRGLVIVLTDGDTFEDRLEFARAGALGVIPRTHSARQVIEFLSDSLVRRERAQSTVLVLNADIRLTQTLTDALAARDCRLDVRGDAASFWEALEDRGADLVVVGFEGAPVSGSELCRVIRAHPRWHRLPVVVVGGRKGALLDDAMVAGADDYLSASVSAHELGVRVDTQLERGRLTRIRSDIDPLTGTENRTAAERSFDRLLRLATRHKESLAFALITVDNLDQIRQTEGNAVGDIVLRRLGGWLLERFRGEDVVGRWTHDGFAVGLYGLAGAGASERIAEVLDACASEGVPTTSGRRARYSCSAGVASSPADGSTLSSLERLSETALRRAKAGQNHVVMAGERAAGSPSNVVDVVLVEDDDSMADVIEHALRLRDLEFVRFSDGAEAARELGGGHIKAQVVLLDVGLPSLDGFGVLQTLRTQGILDDTRVIMLTARSSEAEMLRALGLGATEHITKPFSVPVLLGRLGQTLSRSVA
jgi:diguanylate cyclase (GGDEF)-like protein